MHFLQIGIELLIGFISLFLMTKVLGKTQITQITTFDFVSALVLGELVGNALYDREVGIKEVLFSVVVWGILIFTTEIITQKFKNARKFLEGAPSIVIRNGKIDFEQLKKNHLDINQLQHLLRSRNVFSIRECEYAILETDGTVSVLQKASYSMPTKQDLNLKLEPVYLGVTIILDGEFIEDNLALINWDKKRLEKELKSSGVHSYTDVLFAEWKKDDGLYIQTY